jgi:hypothetical protein
MARRPAFPPLTSENDKVHFCLCHRFNLLLFVSGFLTVKKSPARPSTVLSSRWTYHHWISRYICGGAASHKIFNFRWEEVEGKIKLRWPPAWLICIYYFEPVNWWKNCARDAIIQLSFIIHTHISAAHYYLEFPPKRKEDLNDSISLSVFHRISPPPEIGRFDSLNSPHHHTPTDPTS